jgi:hypothetical protein
MHSRYKVPLFRIRVRAVPVPEFVMRFTSFQGQQSLVWTWISIHNRGKNRHASKGPFAPCARPPVRDGNQLHHESDPTGPVLAELQVNSHDILRASVVTRRPGQFSFNSHRISSMIV